MVLARRQRAGAREGQHMGDIVGLAQFNPRLPQQRIGGHDMEVELGNRPVAGILIGGGAGALLGREIDRGGLNCR